MKYKRGKIGTNILLHKKLVEEYCEQYTDEVASIGHCKDYCIPLYGDELQALATSSHLNGDSKRTVGVGHNSGSMDIGCIDRKA